MTSGGLRRLVPLTVLGLFPLAALSARFEPVSDPDAFWHITAGRHLLATGQFVVADPPGPFATEPWVLHEWLSEVAMAATFDRFGFPGLAWLGFALTLLLFAALWWSSRRVAGLLPATMAATLGWVGASGSMAPRPQLVSFILLVVVADAWRQTRDDGRARWWLIPLTWLWACLHGLWFLGPGLGLVMIVGMLLERRLDRADLRRSAAVVGLSAAAALATPLGWHILGAVWGVGGVTAFVTEWAPPSIRDPYVIAAMAAVIVVAVAWARRWLTPRATDVLLWGVALAANLGYARTVALGAILLAPLVAAALAGLVGQGVVPRPSAGERATLWIGVGLGLATSALLAPSSAAGTAGYPDDLVAEIAALPDGALILNEYDVGGWLLLTTPEVTPVVDPRTELYAPDMLSAYGRALAAQPGWEMFTHSTGARAALLRETTPLTEALDERGGWQVVARSAGWVLLVPGP